MILTIKYGQLIIINEDIWQHDLENTLSNYTAVIIDYYYNYNYNYTQQQLVINTSRTLATIKTIIVKIKNIIIEPTKISNKERNISNWN